MESSRQSGKIVLLGLRAEAAHGVFLEEREETQPFVVDLELLIDWPSRDDLAETVDYAQAAEIVHEVLSGESVLLIETLAQRIVERLVELPAVQEAMVRVHKPQAPIGHAFEDVYVETRRRK
jgi:dihydroneopterin aldolase